MFKGTILTATKQRWKLGLSTITGVLCIAVFIRVQFFGETLSALRQFELMAIAAIVWGLAFSFALRNIRCPNCQTRWYLDNWNARIGRRMEPMSLQTKCPKCGLHSEQLARLVKASRKTPE